MSKVVIESILKELRVSEELTEEEKEQLFTELRFYFGLAGGAEGCVELEELWSDVRYRDAIAEFVHAWLRRKKRERGRVAYIA